MALYAEITLSAWLGQTRINVEVDEVRDGLHEQVWHHSFLADVGAHSSLSDAFTWLHVALRPVLAYISEQLPIHQSELGAAPDDTIELPFWTDADGQLHE
jgi:hypothetical protein